MLIGIIIIVILLLIVFELFRRRGIFGLYIEVDIDKSSIYYWYKGNIIKSFGFSLGGDGDIEYIEKRKEETKKEALEYIKKIKELKRQL